MAPEAPGRLMTTKDCPVSRVAASAKARATASLPPPTAHGTMISTLGVGYGSARAPGHSTRPDRAMAHRLRRLRQQDGSQGRGAVGGMVILWLSRWIWRPGAGGKAEEKAGGKGGGRGGEMATGQARTAGARAWHARGRCRRPGFLRHARRCGPCCLLHPAFLCRGLTPKRLAL